MKFLATLIFLPVNYSAVHSIQAQLILYAGVVCTTYKYVITQFPVGVEVDSTSSSLTSIGFAHAPL